jgi:hypothetical protein
MRNKNSFALSCIRDFENYKTSSSVDMSELKWNI